MSAITCRQLRKSFGDFEVLRGIDLEVERGELFGFLGPNGAGKTTTIRILTGILQPSSGTVEIAGYDVVKSPQQVKRRVGYVPDRAFLYPKLTGASSWSSSVTCISWMQVRWSGCRAGSSSCSISRSGWTS